MTAAKSATGQTPVKASVYGTRAVAPELSKYFKMDAHHESNLLAADPRGF